MKNINFQVVSPVTDSDIFKLEEKIKLQIPDDLKLFLKEYGGTENQYFKNIKEETDFYVFTFQLEDGYQIEETLSKIDSVNSILEIWQYRDFLFEFQDTFKLSKDYVEVEYLLPIIELMNGKQLYVSIYGKHKDKLYYVDNGDFGIIKITDSLDEFFNRIKIIH